MPGARVKIKSSDGLGLGAREKEVARLVGEGLTDVQISERIGITESTVKNHIGHIKDKRGIESRRGLALIAREHPERLGLALNFQQSSKPGPAAVIDPQLQVTVKEKKILEYIVQNPGKPASDIVVDLINDMEIRSAAFAGMLLGFCNKNYKPEMISALSDRQKKILHCASVMKSLKSVNAGMSVGSELGMSTISLSCALVEICRQFIVVPVVPLEPREEALFLNP